MDEEQPRGLSSKPRGQEDVPDARLLANPLMGDALSDWSPVHEAALQGRVLSLRNLISQGWAVNIVTADGVSPLHEACLGGHVLCAKLLLKHGAQVNGITADRHTPLSNACVRGSLACVDLLLRHGATLEPDSNLAASPIHEAARRGHAECIESLVAHGGDPDRDVHPLGTPLYLACEHRQLACARKLLESAAVAFAACGAEDMLTLLLEFGANPQAKDGQGRRPVDMAPPDSPAARLLSQREGPPSLRQLCRLRIRSCFGAGRHHGIRALVLPGRLQRFLLHL